MTIIIKCPFCKQEYPLTQQHIHICKRDKIRGILNPKLILYHINNGEKTWKELMELLHNPNPNWLNFHLYKWKSKGELDLIYNGNTTIIRKRY